MIKTAASGYKIGAAVFVLQNVSGKGKQYALLTNRREPGTINLLNSARRRENAGE